VVRRAMFHVSGQGNVAGGHVQQRRAVNRLAYLLGRQKTFGGPPDVKFMVIHALHSPPVRWLKQQAGHCVPGTRKKDGRLNRRRREGAQNLRAGTQRWHATKVPAGRIGWEGVGVASTGRHQSDHRV
jgi:hypothetical protein